MALLLTDRAATRKHTMMGQKYFTGGGQTYVWGDKNIPNIIK